MSHNPADEVAVYDLFQKDPEALSEAEIEAMRQHFRDLRVKFAEAEKTAKQKKTRKVADPDDLLDQTADA